MAKAAKQTSTIQFSLVPEMSWWKSVDGSRLMCVLEVHGRGTGNEYHNTHVVMVEVGIAWKKTIAYDTFAGQVRLGNLVQVHYQNAAPLVRYFVRPSLF